jgi:predicted negative regulator of RcsB-dependent stress response
MAEEIDSYEQSERARQWLQQNGGSIVVGILLGLAVLLGWQRWQQSQVNHRAEALLKYEDFQSAVDKQDAELASKLAEDLRKNFSGTAHAALAALEQAEVAMTGGKIDEALTFLEFAAKDGKPDGVRTIAEIRLARLLIAKGEAQRALDRLNKVAVKGFEAEVATVKSDAYLALNNLPEARKALDVALAGTDSAAPQRRSLEIKRDDLIASMDSPAPATAPAPAAEKEAAPAPEAAPAEAETEQG